VMIETALGQLERGSHIVHRSAIVSLLLKETSSSTEDFLSRFLTGLVARFNGSFAKHPEMVSRNSLRSPLPCVSQKFKTLSSSGVILSEAKDLCTCWASHGPTAAVGIARTPRRSEA
jgi:hypothetical protein